MVRHATTAGTERFVVSQKYNSAARLHRLLAPVRRQHPGQPAIDAWARVFSIQTSNQNRRWMAVTQKLQLVLEEVDILEQQMHLTSLRRHTYEDPLEQLRQALDVTALTSTFGEYLQYINDYTLNALDMYTDLLPDQGEPIDGDELDKVAESLADLRHQVERSSELPEYVRSFLLRQIQVLEDALSNYPIVGPAAFLRAQGLGAAIATLEQDVVERYPDNDEARSYLKQLGGTWQWVRERVVDVETMQKILTSGAWLARTALALGDGTGDLPPPA